MGGLQDELRKFIGFWKSEPMSAYGDTSWGVNCIFLLPKLVKTRGIFAIHRNGLLEMYFGYWDERKYKDIGLKQVEFRQAFTACIEDVLGVNFTDKQKLGFPSIPLNKWLLQSNKLLDEIYLLVKRYDLLND